jgi:hypothetical protein
MLRKKYLKENGKMKAWYVTDRASFKTLKDAMPYYDKQVVEKPKAQVSICIKPNGVWVETLERRRGAH